MTLGLGKCSKIRYIVRIRQMIQRWRNKASESRTDRSMPSDVPAGHVVVYVGTRCTRFIIRTTFLNHPIFQKLLEQAAEEYGFTNQGPLTIPCEESVFEEVIRVISGSVSGQSFRYADAEDFQKYCHVAWIESRPLLNGFAEKAIW